MEEEKSHLPTWDQNGVSESNSLQVDLHGTSRVECVDVMGNGWHILPSVRLRRTDIKTNHHISVLLKWHIWVN